MDNGNSEPTVTIQEGKSGELEGKFDPYYFDLDDLLVFLFPQILQHPLAAARLFIFGLYGPLDREGKIRAGRKGSHVLAEYELDEMCIQIEREDVVKIYLHKPRDFGLLTIAQQDEIINQADASLKKTKGKAMLPPISRQDVIDLFQHMERDAFGRISFHEAQKVIEEYHEERVKKYKLMYPNLTSKAPTTNTIANMNQTTLRKTNAFDNASNTADIFSTSSSSLAEKSSLMKSHFVSTAVAPTTMFQKMKGNNNADLIEVTAKQLGKHSFKISDGKATSEITSNIKLLREVQPNFENPYGKIRKDWDSTGAMVGSTLGSKVNAPGSTTWKQKYTLY